MRLYHQPGLSNRVVSALRNRLERVLLGMSADGDARVHGNGAHGEEGDEHRGRSRSRGRAATEDHRSPNLTADGGPGAGIPAVEPLPEAETSVLEVSNALARSIRECAAKISSLTEDLGMSVENVVDARKELLKGFSEMKEQFKAQIYGTTAVTGAVSHQSAEIVKLLKAFDKFAHAGKWALSGNDTVENNVKSVREEVKTQGEKLRKSLQGGFEEINRNLKELVHLMGPEGTHWDTPETPDMGAFIPPNPPLHPPGVVGPTEIHGVTGAALHGGTPPPLSMPAAPASGHAMPPPPTLPESLFWAYCPERPGEQRPSVPKGIATPCQRTGVATKDPSSGVLRTLSPTPYRGDQVSAITALWAPNVLGMLRDGQQQYRRIY